MKKSICLGLPGIIASLAFPFQLNAAAIAGHTTAEKNYFNGAYIGVGINFLSLKKKVDLTETFIHENAETHTYIDEAQLDGGEHHIGGNILLGIGKTFNSWYLGGEIFGLYAPGGEYTGKFANGESIGSMPPDVETYGKVAEVSTDGSWGGLLRFGYLTSPKTIIYFLIGAESTKFNVKIKWYDTTINNANDKITQKFNKTMIAFMPGAGIETMLCENVSLRAQYSYSFYGDMKKTFTYVYPEEAIAANPEEKQIMIHDYKVSPNRNNFSLDLIYQFS